MNSTRAKVLHELGGRPLLHYPLAALGGLGANPVVVVVGHQADAVSKPARTSGIPGIRAVLQEDQRGTGHAVRCALPALEGCSGDVLILYGDAPLIRTATLRRLVERHRAEGADLSLLTVRYDDPAGYGRIVRRADGRVRGIVEERDATPEEQAITEVNPGFYCVRAAVLRQLIAALRDDNAQREYYLTDIVGLAARGGRVIALETDRAGGGGGDQLAERAGASRDDAPSGDRRALDGGRRHLRGPGDGLRRLRCRDRRRHGHRPERDAPGRTRIGRGCRLDGTSWLVDATLADDVHLLFGCWVQEATVGAGAIVGPFARLRPGTRLASACTSATSSRPRRRCWAPAPRPIT